MTTTPAPDAMNPHAPASQAGTPPQAAPNPRHTDSTPFTWGDARKYLSDRGVLLDLISNALTRSMAIIGILKRHEREIETLNANLIALGILAESAPQPYLDKIARLGENIAASLEVTARSSIDLVEAITEGDRAQTMAALYRFLTDEERQDLAMLIGRNPGETI